MRLRSTGRTRCGITRGRITLGSTIKNGSGFLLLESRASSQHRANATGPYRQRSRLRTASMAGRVDRLVGGGAVGHAYTGWAEPALERAFASAPLRSSWLYAHTVITKRSAVWHGALARKYR